ncbi:MAG: leucine-rich repeat protein [Clostridia bacterium]|nr:leucine-rich repeat protein [Clostridia bacterium]
MKKALTVFFTILIMCCIFTVVSMATEIGGVDYKLTESADGNTAQVTTTNKTVTTKNVVIPKTVEYEGKTYTVTSIQGRAFEKNKNIETLVIEADFAENGYGTYVFNECSNLKTVTLPDTMKKIPDRWFRMCTSLESINFPYGITAIEDCAFWRCTSLKSIDLPSTITSVGEKAFEDCTAITTINCATPTLGYRMFYNCKAVQSITLTGTVTIKSDAFYYCGIKNSGNTLIIPQTVTTIEDNAFRYCFFDTVVIPKGLTTVSANAFANMKNYSDLIKYTGMEEEAQTYFANIGIPYELVNHCETYNNGNHTYDNETCIANCTECGIAKTPTLSDHTLTLEYAYENGFVSSGEKITKCTVEGCKYSVSEEIQAIISLIGYSSKIGGEDICVSYAINQKAYKEYKNAGYTLNFGVVAYVPSEGETDLEPVNSDLSGKTTNTVVASIDCEYVGFDFVINGFNEEHHGLSLVMCAYVYDGETVSYVSTSGENSVQTKYAQTITYYYE